MESFASLKNRRWFRAVVPALALLSGFVACTEAGEFTATQVRIFDGDSFVAMRSNGTEVEIRLFGIDAPERNQPWSRKSRDGLRALLGDADFSARTIAIDRYGRTVAVVTLPDGRQVNSEMIAAGHAWVYRRFTDDPAMIALEDQAKADNRGLWSLSSNEQVPPWQWRNQKRKKSRR
jgi:endonuclease YncB( thermonuclease family)